MLMKNSISLFVMSIICLLLISACTPEKQVTIPQILDIAKVSTFACGPSTCAIENEYCLKMFSGAIPPGTDGITYSCKELPHLDCVEIRKTGKCFGSIEEGVTIEVYLP